MKYYLFILAFICSSCAALSYHKSFKLEQKEATSYSSLTGYGNDRRSIILFTDGSVLLVNHGNIPLNTYLAMSDDLYEKWTDLNSIYWGVYSISNDSLQMEFIEKVHAWGFHNERRWVGLIDESHLEILPNYKVAWNSQRFSSMNYRGESLDLIDNKKLEKFGLDPGMAWTNK